MPDVVKTFRDVSAGVACLTIQRPTLDDSQRPEYEADHGGRRLGIVGL
jgi:hypothetical protein